MIRRFWKMKIRKLLISLLLASATLACSTACNPASEGLLYSLSSDKTYYILEDLGFCTDKDIVIPSTFNKLPVKKIDDWAFRNHDGFHSVTIPDSVTRIGAYVFSDSSLASIKIPNSVTYIDAGAFYNCDKLTSIQIPNSVIGINGWTFYDCDSLTSIELPDSVTFISGANAFYDCDNLTSVKFSNTITSIEDGTFANCDGLTSIVIPASVTYMGRNPFGGCSALKSIVVEKGNTTYHSAENCIIETTSKTLIAGCNNSTIPADGSVTTIEEAAFSGCQDLTSLVIPEGVTSIRSYAFSSCTSLTSMVIPNGVISLEAFTFGECSGLTSIVIPESVRFIAGRTFYLCPNLTSITFQGTKAQWEKIWKESFWDSDIGIYTVHCTDGDIQKE